MKRLSVILSVMVLLFATSCKQEQTKEAPQNIIGKHMLELKSDIMTPEILWAFGRLSEAQVSPDHTKILYGVTYYSVEEDKSNRELFLMNIDGSNQQQLTKTPGGEYGAVWTPDGKKIGYMSAASGSMQLWEMEADGSNPHQVSDYEDGITGFLYSPDMKNILFTKEVKVNETVIDANPDLNKTTGRIMTDLMYRHWDGWVDSFSHIFVNEYKDGTLGVSFDIMEGQPWDAPLKPFGGIEQITWAPDGRSIVYTSRKLVGKEYSVSTNSDLYSYNLDSAETTNLTEGMMGYDINPVFSPDGSMMAWESMERNGYESDKSRLFVLNVASGEKTYLTKDFDQNANSLSWSTDGKSIYFISDWHATDEIYRLDIADGKITKITEGVHNYNTAVQAGDRLIATRVSMSKPAEIYSVDPVTGEAVELSFENKHLLDQLTFGEVTKRWVVTTDNKQMLVWVILPPHFDANKTYPGLLYCEGGPQSTVSQFWSYRWNFQMMAANDYVIVAPNRRGLPGFGQAWLEQISGDYGGQNMKDYLSAIDAVSKEKWLDENRLGAVGASYGGFSVYWLAGHNLTKRFKAFIAHDGIFNLEQQYLETDEMWFANWDLGGPFWDKSNEIAQRSYANSPHRFVQNWNAPILVIHSELDYRIVASQGMSAFNAAILRGIPAEYLYFPNESHWVLHPQNGILWQRTFYQWLDKWLK